jgi:hypothetical protein
MTGQYLSAGQDRELLALLELGAVGTHSLVALA